jgi:hypothetical protein
MSALDKLKDLEDLWINLRKKDASDVYESNRPLGSAGDAAAGA